MYHKTDALKKHQRIILKTFNRENYEELKFKQRVKKKTVPKKEKKNRKYYLQNHHWLLQMSPFHPLHSNIDQQNTIH